MASYKPPGQLGDPTMEVKTDPRTNPRLLAALTPIGLAGRMPTPNMSLDATIEELTPLMAADNAAVEGLYEMLPNDLPGDDSEPAVEHRIETIPGVDGNPIKLHIHRRVDTAGQKLPCVVYLHGGGMVVICTENKVHMRWCKSMALRGVVAIAVDFRNAYTAAGHNPFPAGLNDCAAGVQWIATHKAELGIDSIVVQGESGGGNLSCATALKANREGWVSAIDGVYGCAPFVSGAYGWSKERQLKELPSLIENESYMINVHDMALNVRYYTPNRADETNPLAWPLHASPEDLKGLPPHILNMDELDPLRDEGVAYGNKLLAAGVHTVSTMNVGVTHATSLVFRQALPEIHNTTVENIVAFAKSIKKPAARL